MAALDVTLPDLQLDDIMHGMTPSPTPQYTGSVQARPRSASPEPLTEADIVRMRHRVAEIGGSFEETGGVSDREKELLDMVHRLTASTLIDPSQLIHQAEVISGLTSQRDFLVRQAEEERDRWSSQRDGWERMAEALIAQRNRTTNVGAKDADLERYCAAYESDNRALREKLNDTQTRLQCLEAELSKLRPILLMQPVSSQQNASAASSVPYPNIQAAADKAKPKKKKKKEPRVAVFSVSTREEPEVSDSQTETQPMEGVQQSSASSSFFQFQAQPAPPPSTAPAFTGDHYRKPTTTSVGGPLTAPPTTLEFQVNAPPPPPSSSNQLGPRTIRRASPSANAFPSSSAINPPHTPETATSGPNTTKSRTKSRRPQGAPLTPLTSDARTEHLLLAARKIGRERAGIVAGYVRDRQREVDMQKQEKERERVVRDIERLERERADRLAERGAGGLSYYRAEAGGNTTSGGPQTPKRGGSHYPNTGASPRVVNTSFVIVEPSMIAGTGNGGDGQGKSQGGTAQQQQQADNGNKLNTPRQQKVNAAASGSQQPLGQAGNGNPSTPLASLLDAARMMDDDAAADSRSSTAPRKGRRNGVNGTSDASTTSRRRGVASVDQPESPAPKRRRIQTVRVPVSHFAGARRGGEEEQQGVGRVKSALDVLADQAAAFSSHDQRGKGKGQEVQEVDDDVGVDHVPMSAAKKVRGRAKASAKEKEKEKPTAKPKPVATRKPRGKAAAAAAAASLERIIAVPPALPEKQALVAPRMISLPGLKPSALNTQGSGASGSSPPSASGISPLDVLPPRQRMPEAGHAGPPMRILDRQEELVPGEASSSSGHQLEQDEQVEEGTEVRRAASEDRRMAVVATLAPPLEIQDSRPPAGKSRSPGSLSSTPPQGRDVEMQDFAPLEVRTQQEEEDARLVETDLDATQPTESGSSLDQLSVKPALEVDNKEEGKENDQSSEHPDTAHRTFPPHSPPSRHSPGAGAGAGAGVGDSQLSKPDEGEANPDPDADADAEADIDEGDADADGEVDAEGELDLDEMDVPHSASHPVSNPSDTTNTSSPLPGMPNGHHPLSNLTHPTQDASLPDSAIRGPDRFGSPSVFKNVHPPS